MAIDHATDRTYLLTQAYASGANLDARKALYRFQRPQLQFVDWALDQIDWHGARAAADVGCGNGAYLGRLAGRVPRVIGLDLSRGMLAEIVSGHAAHAPLRLAVADAQALPLRSACLDVALAMHMLYHVPDIAAAARELRRVLRPSGVLLAATNGEGHLRELFDLLAAACVAVGGAPRALPISFRRFTAENGRAVLETAFAHVEWRATTAALLVPETAPIIAYLNSLRGWAQHELPPGVTWETCLAHVERLVAEHLRAEGALRIATVAGVFVCR
jgi:SAM-dependent methyltransferase